MKVLVTGSTGLVGSEAVQYFDRLSHSVVGIDNNMRRDFFGDLGDTRWKLSRLKETTRNFVNHEFDIRDRQNLERL